MAHLRYIQFFVTISVTIQLTLSIKTNSRPVYEIINEQTKSDERLIKTSAVANLPYGNPLAGNSQQNAQLHAHNQQAMFNAERIRQHKAQLQQQQKWLKTPRVHNYMLTQESQENHQLALERAQAEINDDKEDSKKTTEENDVVKEPERRRRQRSYGTEYKTYVVNNQNLKPNVINEMAQTTKFYQQDPSQRYPVEDIETLNSLLNKNTNDQLTEFNALINNPKNINQNRELEIPNLYHLEPTKNPIPEITRYAQIPIIEEYTNIPIKDNDSEKAPLYIQGNMEPVTKNIQYKTDLNHIVTAVNPLYEEEYKKINYMPIFNQNANIREDLNRYWHNKGFQLSNKDGADKTGYDNVSINIRHKRSVLDTSPFLLHNETNGEIIKEPISNTTELPKPESLIRINLNSKRREYGTFLNTPKFPIGEAIDYNNDYKVSRRPNPNYGIPEYDQDYDSFDYEFETQKQPIQKQFGFPTYAPESYSHMDLKSNYGNRPIKRFPDISTTIGPIFSSNLAYTPYIQNYGIPYTQSQTKFNLPTLQLPEPVYLLTQSQLSKLVGHHNLNIEHLDVFQLSKDKRNHPRKYKKRPQNRDIRNNLLKLHKLHLI